MIIPVCKPSSNLCHLKAKEMHLLKGSSRTGIERYIRSHQELRILLFDLELLFQRL